MWSIFRSCINNRKRTLGPDVSLLVGFSASGIGLGKRQLILTLSFWSLLLFLHIKI